MSDDKQSEIREELSDYFGKLRLSKERPPEIDILKDILCISQKKALKRYGQNWLYEERVLEIIKQTPFVDRSRSAKDNKYEFKSIFETGAGLGALTEKLIELPYKLTAVEIDQDSFAILGSRFAEEIKEQKLQLINDDILTFSLQEYLQKEKIENGEGMVAYSNLPYKITTPYAEKFLIEAAAAVHVLLLQAEATERFFAENKSKEYGPLSVFSDYFFIKEKICKVGRSAFYPQPHVDSQVIAFFPKAKALEKEYKDLSVRKDFYQFIKRAFSQRRKTLRNNLAQYYNNVEELSGEFADLRAEALDYREFSELYKRFKNKGELKL